MFHTTSLIKELRVLQLQRGITYPKAVNNQPLNDLYSHFIIYFSLFPTRYTVFPSTYNICHPLSSTCFRPHRPIIRWSKLYMQPMVFSPLQMSLSCGRWERTLSQRPHDKDICRGGQYHRLHVQFRPPDDGPVRPETCRGKRMAHSVRRRKNSVSSWK